MQAASPGERLRMLRDLLGITQEQLAAASGVAQSWISQVETLTRDATEDGLQAIAKATDTPRSFFDAHLSTVPLDTLRFRKNATASRVTTRRVHTFFAESHRVTEELLAPERYPAPPLPYTTAAELSQDDIEDLAAQTREALRLAPDAPVPHLTRVLERAGVPVAPIVLSDDPHEPPSAGGHFGLSYWGGLDAPALIGYFTGTSGDRERFTIGHELGHLVLHTFRPRAANAEDEANRFSGALFLSRRRAVELLNEQLLLSDYARLKATWGLSIQALIMRASALGLITDARKTSLFTQLSSRGWRKCEPVNVGHETPVLLWTLLRRRFGNQPRAFSAAAEVLKTHVAVLRSIAPRPADRTNGAGATVRNLRRS